MWPSFLPVHVCAIALLSLWTIFNIAVMFSVVLFCQFFKLKTRCLCVFIRMKICVGVLNCSLRFILFTAIYTCLSDHFTE